MSADSSTNTEMLLTPAEASEILNVGRWAIIRMVKQGWLDVVLNSNGVRFRLEEVRRIADDTTIDPIQLHCPCAGPCYCHELDFTARALEVYETL